MPKHKQARRPTTASKPATATPRPGGAVAIPRVPLATKLPFALAILTGALLLFAVQPLIARYLLPWFGGGPGVWTTCMLFFQALLLGGYLYAHLSVRYLPTRGQIVLHLFLLAAALAMIPIIPATRWKPTDAADPVGRILLLLGATIGLPYFVLSATSPLLQAWFVRARPGISPYRLFALSNLGSLLALIGYPTILEPLLTRQQQAWTWSIGLILFALTCGACAIDVWRRRSPVDDAATATGTDSRERSASPVEPHESARTILLWLALPTVASVLLLAITNTMTEDVASLPMLWVVPLSLYLLTFVIAFDSPRWYPRRWILPILPLAALWVLRLQWLKTDTTLFEQFIGYSLALFVLCLFCHGELARRKPAASKLTAYYLAIAVGGAVGGLLVAVVAPHVFNRLLELPLGVLGAAALGWLCLRRDPVPNGKRWSALFLATAVLLPVGTEVIKPLTVPQQKQILARARNFYGTLVVEEFDNGSGDNPGDRVRALNHGSTGHGAQFLTPSLRRSPTLYYRVEGGAGLALQHFPRKENRRVGLVGLGVGTLATYGKAGDTFRFYEINPDVERLAREYFTFLADTPAKTDVVLGDARLALEREDPQQFDVLVLDAFTGDSIPTHLLTSEAFDLYQRHLAPDGVIAVHISNRSVDLIQVVLRQSERLGTSYCIVNDRDPVGGKLLSRWMLLTRNQAFLSTPAVFAATRWVHANPDVTLWTDDHTPLLKVTRFFSKS